MSITENIDLKIERLLQKDKVGSKEWNDIVPYLKKRIIDISEAFPTQTAYIFSGVFRGVFRYKDDFYKVDGSFGEIRIKKVNDVAIREVFK